MNSYNQLNISGSLVLRDQEFAWRFSGGVGTIISQDNDRLKKCVSHNEYVEEIIGKISQYSDILFIDTKFEYNLTNINFYPKGIIIFKFEKFSTTFDALKISGDFLNKLYDPLEHTMTSNETEIENILETGENSYKVLPYEETDIDFHVDYKDIGIDFSFNIVRNLGPLSLELFNRTSRTLFYSKFSKKMTVSEIIDLYQVIIVFFKYLLFSNAFAANKLELCMKNEQNKYDPVAELIFDSKYLSVEKISTKYQNLTKFKNNLSGFFLIAVERFQNSENKNNMSVDNFIGEYVDFNPNFKVASYQDVIDLAMSFENYYERNYFDKGKNNKPTDFEASLRDSLCGVIDRLLAEKKDEKNVVTGDNRSLAKKYRKIIERNNSSLESKIKEIIKCFPLVTELLFGKYATDWIKTERGKIPFYFSEFRNKLLHGNYVRITTTVNICYAIVRYLTYTILLSEVGFDESEIVNIIKGIPN